MMGEAIASALAQTVPVNLLVQHDREGWHGKFNEIIGASRREFVIPLCDDDLLAPTYVERCLEFADEADIVFTDRRVWWTGWLGWRNWRSWLRRTPRTGWRHRMFGKLVQSTIATGQAKPVENVSVACKPVALMEIPPQSFALGAPFPLTCMIRRSFFESLGGYDDTIPHLDTEFWYRAVKAGARVVYVPEPLFLYRFHGAQFSREKPSNGAAALAFHRKHFMDFGFAFTPRTDDPQLSDCTIIPEAERAEYVRRHGMKVA